MTNRRPPDLATVLACAATDGEGVAFNRDRMRVALAASKDAAVACGRVKFLRDLGFAWMDAPDGEARRLICRTIHAHLIAVGQRTFGVVGGAPGGVAA